MDRSEIKRLVEQGAVWEIIREIESKQAKIDELMLEYCPDEMTQGQLENWENRQKPLSEVLMENISNAMGWK